LVCVTKNENSEAQSIGALMSKDHLLPDNDLNIESYHFLSEDFDCDEMDVVLSKRPLTKKIIFWFVGHGDNQSNEYPTFTGKKNQSINLRDVHEFLCHHHFNLVITIGDCCSQPGIARALYPPSIKKVTQNYFNFTGYVAPSPNAIPKSEKFFSQFLSGLPSDFSVQGKSAEKNVQWLQQVVQSMVIKTKLPGVSKGLLEYALMEFDLDKIIFHHRLPVFLNYTNPFDVDVILYNTSVNVTYQGTLIGNYTGFLNITLQKRSITKANSVDLQIDGVSYDFIKGLLDKDLKVEVSGVIEISLGGEFTVVIDYFQYGVPASLQIFDSDEINSENNNNLLSESQ